MINDKAQCEKVLAFFGHESKGSLKINHSNFDCENCQKSFLAGAFLSCGTASDPNKDYHLEFTVAFLNLSKSLVTLLEEIDLAPKTANRKESTCQKRFLTVFTIKIRMIEDRKSVV